MLKKLKHLIKNPKFYFSLCVIFFSGALFILILDFILMPAYTNYGEGVTIPNVTRLSLPEADSLLSASGLRFEISERRSNSAYPANYVIDQTPGASEIVKPNRKVYLTINLITTPTVEVPKLVSLSPKNAKLQLQNIGLTYGTVSYESHRFKTVLKQSIPAGKKVEKGTSVNLSVGDGLGENMIEMPDIIGKQLREAQIMLRDAGLRVGEFKFEPNKQYPPNTILDFSPKQQKLNEGTTITLFISERFELIEESESGAIVDTTYITDPDSSQLP